MGKLLTLLSLFVCLLCFGCKTTSISNIDVDVDESNPDIKTIAVMKFDDWEIQGNTKSSMLLSTITNPDAGDILADIMSSELAQWGRYKVTSHAEVKRILRKENLDEESLIRHKVYSKLGNILSVDAIIFGKVHEFGLSSALVYQRGNAAFHVECVDSKNGNIMWSFDVDESAPYKNELELASKLIKDSLERLEREIY